MTDTKKTHWLQNPNKNYFGHQDFPNENPLILTIKSAEWEAVINPRTEISEDKRVVRFVEQEKYNWLKPMIINETNAYSILKSTGVKYMEDASGYKLKLYIATIKVKREKVECIRISEETQQELNPAFINKDQEENLRDLISVSPKTEEEICKLMKIDKLADLPLKKLKAIEDRLKSLVKDNAK
jgi:hypothetical protein